MKPQQLIGKDEKAQVTWEGITIISRGIGDG